MADISMKSKFELNIEKPSAALFIPTKTTASRPACLVAACLPQLRNKISTALQIHISLPLLLHFYIHNLVHIFILC